MTYFFQLPQYFLRQILAGVLALFTLLATPAAGQFLSDGVTPVTPIPNSNATLRAHIGSCLAEQPVTGLCTTWGDNSGFGAIPSWDVSNVNNFDNAFNIKTTFNGDVSRWDMSNATSLKLIFGQAYVFNQDISRWDVSNVTNFDGAFYATGFNQDVSGWNVTSGTNFNNMFQRSGNFNQDIRKWDVRPGASFTNMFLNTTAMTATYVDGTARFDNGELRLNGDFFALSSVREQSAEVVTTGAFNFTSDRDGNFSGYFNGRSALEVQLAHDMVLGYFLGVEVGRAKLSGTFAGRQDSYGLNVGGYVLRSFNDVSYIAGFAALGRNKNQLVVSNGTLQVDSDFDSTTLRLGASATGVFRMPRIEIWPELSFSYAKSRVGSQAVAAQAYGLTANNLSLAGGDVEMGQLMFMPQIKWPLGDGRDSAAVANFSLSPRLTCRVIRGAGGGCACGTSAALGYSAASGDGLTLFNATVEFDNVADTKNGSLTFNVEHNF